MSCRETDQKENERKTGEKDEEKEEKTAKKNTLLIPPDKRGNPFFIFSPPPPSPFVFSARTLSVIRSKALLLSGTLPQRESLLTPPTPTTTLPFFVCLCVPCI